MKKGFVEVEVKIKYVVEANVLLASTFQGDYEGQEWGEYDWPENNN